MTLNLWHTPTRLEERIDAVVAEIEARDPDAVAFQEVAPYLRDGAKFDPAVDTVRTVAEVIAERTGMHLAGQSPLVLRGVGGEYSCLATLTREPAEDVALSILPGHGAGASPDPGLLVSTRTRGGRTLVVANVHAAWGGRHEGTRTRQLMALDALCTGFEPVTRPGTITVLCGDLNTVPGSDTYRYLTGLSAFALTDADADTHPALTPGLHGTFWVDAWTHTAPAGADGTTNGGDNPWAANTAAQVGLHGAQPPRRIDYILVRDWVFGRPGHPLAARRAFTCRDVDTSSPHTIAASDHWGVEVDVADPRT